MGHRFDPTILREYDIRGIVGKTLSSADAQAIGRAYALTLVAAGSLRIAVGYDGRLTSPELEAALVDGLVTEGADVVRIGRGPTPMLYYAASTLGVDGGIMVTGSHNPPDHNGFKFVAQGKPFYGAAIQRLGEIAFGFGAPNRSRGRVTKYAIRNDYVERLARDYDGALARQAHPVERNDRWYLSGTSPGPDDSRESGSVATGGGTRALRPRRRLRR